MKQKGTSPVLIVLLIVIIGVVGNILAKNPSIVYKPGQKLSPTPIRYLSPTPSSQIPIDSNSWKVYRSENAEFEFNYPPEFSLPSPIPNGTGFSQEFDDPNNQFSLSVSVRGNYNNKTGEPFASLRDYAGMPYAGTILTVDQQQGLQYLPRAGSENANSVFFFAKDLKDIYSLELDALSREANQILQGQILFHQIVSTFKFLPKSDSNILLIIYSHGGLCPEGECNSTTIFTVNGDVTKEGQLITTLVPAEAAKLKWLIDSADYPTIMSKKFTGLCPTSYDGHETIYTIYTSRGNKVISSCQQAIDYSLPLFSEITNILSQP